MRARLGIVEPAPLAAGPRRRAVRVSLSPIERGCVGRAAARQGWSAGTWIGAITEAVEEVGQLTGGWLDMMAWERAADLAWGLGMAGWWMADAGIGKGADELRRLALLAERVWRAQAGGALSRGAEDLAAAARYAELTALNLGPNGRACGGAARERVDVMVSERGWVILSAGVANRGWTASDWLATTACAAAGWLAAGGVDEAALVSPWLPRLESAGAQLAALAPRHGTQQAGACELEGLATAALAALTGAHQGLLQVGSTITRRRDQRRVDLDEVEAILGWSDGGQLALNVGGSHHHGVTRAQGGRA